MILKASQRSGGQDLAVHLMRLDDNEHVSLHELRGFASDNLKGAFREAEAISQGTKCLQYLFSLSLSPPSDARVTVDQFCDAIDRIEDRLGLDGQPRAVVFHEKEGRRHAHCVWSRIDADTMTARQLSFFKTKLMRVSRDLYLEHGWKMPDGISRAGDSNPTNFSLAEWQQAKRNGVDPRLLKETVQLCWKASDSMASFKGALASHALTLAAGDRRGIVLLDHMGEVHALSRQLGIKYKDIETRIGDFDSLPSVTDARKLLALKMTPAMRAHLDEARGQFAKRSEKLGEQKAEMTQLHRAERLKLAATQKLERDNKNRDRAARLPKGLRGLWHRIITGEYQKVRASNEDEAKATQQRHAAEADALTFRQLDQRAVLQSKFKDLRRQQARQLIELRQDIGRYLKFTQGREVVSRTREFSLGLKLGRD